MARGEIRYETGTPRDMRIWGPEEGKVRVRRMISQAGRPLQMKGREEWAYEKMLPREEPERARGDGTTGRSSKRNDTALHYRLQMTALTRKVAGEAVGARTVERVRGIAPTVDVMMSQEKGHVGRVVQEVGSMLCTTHMDCERKRAYFGGGVV